MEDLQLIIELVKERTGTDLRKFSSSFLNKRIQYSMDRANQRDYNSYYRLLKSKRGEVSNFLSRFNVQVSWFFRNRRWAV